MSKKMGYMVGTALLLLSSQAILADDTPAAPPTTTTTTTTTAPVTDTTAATTSTTVTTPSTDSGSTTVVGKPSEEENKSVKDEIEKLNKTLPNMIDKVTELNHISLEGQDIIYKVRIVTYNATDIDSKKFESAMRPDLIKSICGDEKIVTLLKDGYTLNYKYNGKDDNLIVNIPIAMSDCKK